MDQSPRVLTSLSPPEADAVSTPHPLAWRMLRLSLMFVLDIVEISRADREILDPLILSVVSSASVAPVTQDPALEHAYATVESPPPDELRRPVSVNAVAHSLRLPYETVRRRIGNMVEAGLLEMTPRGVMQSAAAVSDPAYLAQALARYERLRRFYFEMLAAGALPDPASRQTPAALPDGPPVRIANRIIGEYMLRFLDELISVSGDRLRGLILLQIARATGEHVNAVSFRGEAPMPEAMRRPVPVAQIAARLRFPAETVRRHALKLQKAGLVRRVEGGLILAADNLQEGVASMVNDNAANLGRLFTRLAHLGVLNWWDAEAETTA